MQKQRNGNNMAKSKLFEYFQGMYVQVLIDRDLENTIQEGDSMAITKMPLAVRGYLMEQDDDYLYLSQNLDPLNILITGAVRKDFILHVELGQEETVQEMDTSKLDLPSNPEGWN